MRRCLAYITSAILLAAAACGGGERSAYSGVGDGWRYTDTLAFDLSDPFAVSRPDSNGHMAQPADTAAVQCGSLAVAVRHTNAYAYSDLWLEVQYAGADTMHTDTVRMFLADKYGNWRGRGMGVTYQYIQTVLPRIFVDTNRKVKLRHIMRTDTLENIEQIGVVFKPAK